MNHIIRKLQLKQYRKDYPELTEKLEAMVERYGKYQVQRLLNLIDAVGDVNTK